LRLRRVAATKPTSEDIGRRAVHFGKSGVPLLPAYGAVTSFDDHYVFISYGGENMSMLREDLTG
jgi:hypothetical protein